MTDDPTPDTGIKAEATDAGSVTVQWNDQEWMFPPSLDDCDFLTLQAWESGRVFRFIELVLKERDPHQWGRFLRGNRRTGHAASEFMKSIFRDGWGVDLGE